MKTILATVGLLLMASGCASYDRLTGGDILYNGYYDDSYGPIYDGYWGEADTFYYRGGREGPYLRDEGRHFRREAGQQDGESTQHFHAMSGHGPRNHRGR